MAEVAPGPSRNQPAAVFKAPMVRVSAQVQEEGGSSEARVEPVSATSSEAADAERNDLSDEPDETLQAQEVAAAVSMLDDETEEPSG